MLDYARQRARNVLKNPRKVILATSGPAGVHVSEFPCEAIDLDLYLLIPKTSEHFFNLENDHAVTLLSSSWEVKGEAELINLPTSDIGINFLNESDAEWCRIVRVHPHQIHIRRPKGWGYCESIEI